MGLYSGVEIKIYYILNGLTFEISKKNYDIFRIDDK